MIDRSRPSTSCGPPPHTTAGSTPAEAPGAAGIWTDADLLTPLRSTVLLRAEGEDVDHFLQGQLSSDLRKLNLQRSHLAAYSSPKGRVLAIFTLSRSEDGAALLEINRDIADAVIKRLRMFILRARVRLKPADTWTGLGVAGPHAAEALTALGLSVPAEVGATAWSGGVQIARRHGDRARFTVWGHADRITEIQAALQRSLPLGDDVDWRRIELIAGVPSVYRQTQDHFVAQMLNLDLLGGISFDKGCYTGQEVIARLHYLGNLKRRMFRLWSDARDVVPGTAIIDPSGTAVGEVVDSADSEAGSIVSAVLRLAHLHAPLHLQDHEPGALSAPEPFAAGLPPLPAPEETGRGDQGG